MNRKHNKTQWIPTSEGLPDIDTEVWLTVRSTYHNGHPLTGVEVVAYSCVTKGHYSDDEFYEFVYDCYDLIPKQRVLAWMPLPEPEPYGGRREVRRTIEPDQFGERQDEIWHTIKTFGIDEPQT